MTFCSMQFIIAAFFLKVKGLEIVKRPMHHLGPGGLEQGGAWLARGRCGQEVTSGEQNRLWADGLVRSLVCHLQVWEPGQVTLY